MIKHDYTALDAAILEAIKSLGRAPFVRLQGGDVLREANVLAEAHNAGIRYIHQQKPNWRFIDNRLQALRKAGRIRFQRKPEGWFLVDAR